MATLTITIPDDKLELVLTAFATRRGIEPTLPALRQEFAQEIRKTVRQWRQSQVPYEEI